MEKENFEIVVEGEYCTDMIRNVEKLLDEKLPDYTKHKVLIIRMVDKY